MQKYKVKKISKKIIEVEGKLAKGTKVPQPPSWFYIFETNLNKRLDNIDIRLDNIDSRLDKLDHRIDNLVQLNNLKESQSAKIQSKNN